MKNLKIIGLFLVVFAVCLIPAAVAATQYTRLLNLKVAGLTLLGNTNDSNAIDNSVVADVDYDFANGTIICTDSWAVTATGVKVGDACEIGIGPRDGGTQIITANSVFIPLVSAANEVKVRHCPVGTAADPVDAGYVVRCFSSP